MRLTNIILLSSFVLHRGQKLELHMDMHVHASLFMAIQGFCTSHTWTTLNSNSINNIYDHTTILYKTRWDTCSTNHHYVHINQDVCVQNDMYDSISMF